MNVKVNTHFLSRTYEIVFMKTQMGNNLCRIVREIYVKLSKLCDLSSVQHIRKMQPTGPYTLCGYSFGACVAFEMGLQLEKLSERVQLVLLDGSPSYVAAHTGNYRARHGPKQSVQDEESDALTYFISLFSDVDYQKVSALTNLLLLYVLANK